MFSHMATPMEMIIATELSTGFLVFSVSVASRHQNSVKHWFTSTESDADTSRCDPRTVSLADYQLNNISKKKSWKYFSSLISHGILVRKHLMLPFLTRFCDTVAHFRCPIQNFEFVWRKKKSRVSWYVQDFDNTCHGSLCCCKKSRRHRP